MLEAASTAWAVIPAGGSGSRFSTSHDKLRANLQGVPVLIHTLQALLKMPSLQGLVLVSSLQNQAAYQALIKAHLPNAPIHYAIGGNTRRNSVYQGLLALPDNVDIVAVHDAARPWIRPAVVEQAIGAIRQGACGAVVAVPVQDTLKQVSDPGLVIEATVDRSQLWRAQTPQVFNKAALLQAHRQIASEMLVTDDAQLLELAGLGPVLIIPGDESNLKITTPGDLALAAAFLQANPTALL